MIDKKIILYVLLGVTVFALWEAWQKDYAPSLPPKAPLGATTSFDGASLAAAPTSGHQPLVSAAPPAARLITARTDTLEVVIDTLGGNVVAVDLLKYPAVIYQAKPIKLLSSDPQRYYVAQSSLMSSIGPDREGQPAHYVSSHKEYWLKPDQDSLKIKLTWNGAPGITVTKVFTLQRNKYDIAVDYEIDNRSPTTWMGQFYAALKRKNFDSSKSWFQFSTYTGAAVSSADKPYEKISFADMESATKNSKEIIRDSQGGWVAMQQRYFLSAWVPTQERLYRYFNQVSDGVYTIGLSDNAVTVPAGSKTTLSSILYAGPEITENLAPLAPGLDRTVDYGWLWLISVGFFWVLKNIYKLVGNWGVAIILVTLLIKLVFYKLSESSGRSMARMRELMPKMQAIKERYKDDRQKLHQATMELYKKEKINPLSLGGCLPMLIQIPFFIALYYVLIAAVELRHAPFMLWIHDLSAPDPFYVMPILMGVSMLLQQRLTPSSADPAQAKMMMFMPIIFTIFFLNFPSGLVLYWLVNNLLSILQQWYINKKLATTSGRRLA